MPIQLKYHLCHLNGNFVFQLKQYLFSFLVDLSVRRNQAFSQL